MKQATWRLIMPQVLMRFAIYFNAASSKGCNAMPRPTPQFQEPADFYVCPHRKREQATDKERARASAILTWYMHALYGQIDKQSYKIEELQIQDTDTVHNIYKIQYVCIGLCSIIEIAVVIANAYWIVWNAYWIVWKIYWYDALASCHSVAHSLSLSLSHSAAILAENWKHQ